MSRWNKESIAKERREKAIVNLAGADHEQLIERIVALETALYPFAYVCGSLNEKAWRGTNATSKLFPMLSDNEKFLVYEDGKSVEGEKIPESKLHEVEYYEADSIYIEDGTTLDDDFDILSVHQQAPGAYVGCGSITMSDVRAAVALIFPHRGSDVVGIDAETPAAE